MGALSAYMLARWMFGPWAVVTQGRILGTRLSLSEQRQSHVYGFVLLLEVRGARTSKRCFVAHLVAQLSNGVDEAYHSLIKYYVQLSSSQAELVAEVP